MITNLSNGISVIICCYNSSARLQITLKHLALQQLPIDLQWEVIIVNNASKDNTIIVAKEEWRKYNLKQVGFKIIEQPLPGLSNARMKGVEEANYKYIVFCDDDNWLDSKYLTIAYNIMESNHNIGVLGGQGEAVSDIEFPYWFDEFMEGYAVGKQGLITGDITYRRYLWGAGMVTRRELFLKAFPTKYPSLLTDRKGNQLSSGGDSEFAMRLIMLGYKLFYDERLIFKHFMPKERLTESYRDRLFEGFKNSQLVLNEYKNQLNYYFLLRSQKLKVFMKTIIRFIICKIYPNKKWSEQDQVNMIYRIARISTGRITNEVKSIADFVWFQKRVKN